MRKVAGLVLLGLGAFLLVSAGMLKLYAYPALAKVPLDQYSKSVSQGSGMEAFYVKDLQTKSGLTLTSTRFVKADQAAQEKEGDNVAVWDSFVRSTDAEGTVLSATVQRVAMDRTTGEAVQCCGTYVADSEDAADRTPTKYEGLIFKFPFDAEKKTYKWWDGTLLKTVDAKYLRSEKLSGTDVYVYRMVIPATPYTQQEIPAKLAGDPTATGNVTVDRVYENTRTLWVEPNTGIIVKGEEQLNTRFQKDGQDVVTLQKGTIGYDQATVKANAEDAGDKGSKLHLVRSTLPLVFLILGLVALLGGFLTLRGIDRRGRREAV
jgi:Porin PorA